MFFTVVVLPVLGREVVKFKSRHLHHLNVPGILEFPSPKLTVVFTYVQKLGSWVPHITQSYCNFHMTSCLTELVRGHFVMSIIMSMNLISVVFRDKRKYNSRRVCSPQIGQWVSIFLWIFSVEDLLNRLFDLLHCLLKIC